MERVQFHVVREAVAEDDLEVHIGGPNEDTSREFGARSNLIRHYDSLRDRSRFFKGPRTSVANIDVSPSRCSDSASSTTFMTASTSDTFVTARSTLSNMSESPLRRFQHPAVEITQLHKEAVDISDRLAKIRHEFKEALERRKLILHPDQELNWSGKGQHVTYLPTEDVPLLVLSYLGSSVTAVVEKVQCRRIVLARKTVRCNRTITVSNALAEVEHLQRLGHRHIIQLVGSYLQGHNFAVLMYPAADCHLGSFLEETAEMSTGPFKSIRAYLRYADRVALLEKGPWCLSRALSFVHEKTTKHMDIKPANILVRSIARCPTRGDGELPWRVYLADFGLSHTFDPDGHSQTDRLTGRTPRYCAPEVYQREAWGRSADIFSLGCVFAEILTVCRKRHPQDFADFRQADGDTDAYHSCLEKVIKWLDEMSAKGRTKRDYLTTDIVKKMLALEPSKRPLASEIVDHLSKSLYQGCGCCHKGSEPYVAFSDQATAEE